MFLEPFSAVLGQSKSKRVLISLAQSDTRHLNCLHRLGIVLGIMDWVKDYQKKLEPSQSPHTALVEQAKVRIHLEITVWIGHFIYSCQDIFYFLFFQSNLIDSQSSSLSALNSTEDFEEDILDSSFASSQQDTSLHQGNYKFYSSPS